MVWTWINTRLDVITNFLVFDKRMGLTKNNTHEFRKEVVNVHNCNLYKMNLHAE